MCVVIHIYIYIYIYIHMHTCIKVATGPKTSSPLTTAQAAWQGASGAVSSSGQRISLFV